MSNNKVSIITPVYNESGMLPLFFEEVSRSLLNDPTVDYHVLFVDDGSIDNSWPLICEICAKSDRFSALRLSRNFGSHAALAAGFDHVDCNAVATLACDLQDPPETIKEFVKKWKDGAQIVWGHRSSREDKSWKIAASKLLSAMIKRFAMPKRSKFSTGSFLLMDSVVLQALRQFGEVNRTTFALVGWTGFKQEIVWYDRRMRQKGSSGWTFGRMIKTMYDALIGFSELPARIITLIGLVMWIFSFFLAVYILISYAFENVLPGWTSTVLLFTIFSGIMSLMLGVISEYLHRIYIEVARRPIYLISEKQGQVQPLGNEPPHTP